jgi:hypothetical protein
MVLFYCVFESQALTCSSAMFCCLFALTACLPRHLAAHSCSPSSASMPTTVGDLEHPQVRRIVLHVYNRFRHDEKYKRMKYKNTAGLLASQYGLVIDHKVLKAFNVRGTHYHYCCAPAARHRCSCLCSLSCVLRCCRHAQLAKRFDPLYTDAWAREDAGYSSASELSELTRQFIGVADAASNAHGGASSLLRGSTTASAAAAAASNINSAAMLGVMRNMHGEMMEWTRLMRTFVNHVVAGDRDAVRGAIAALQNSAPSLSEDGQSAHSFTPAHSSSGRAPGWHLSGRQFDPLAHHVIFLPRCCMQTPTWTSPRVRPGELALLQPARRSVPPRLRLRLLPCLR